MLHIFLQLNYFCSSTNLKKYVLCNLILERDQSVANLGPLINVISGVAYCSVAAIDLRRRGYLFTLSAAVCDDQ